MTIQKIMKAMITLYSGDAKRIQHFTKVHAYASFIGKEENLDAIKKTDIKKYLKPKPEKCCAEKCL